MIRNRGVGGDLPNFLDHPTWLDSWSPAAEVITDKPMLSQEMLTYLSWVGHLWTVFVQGDAVDEGVRLRISQVC